MISVLIIDDNKDKRDKVYSMLRDVCNVSDENIDLADNIKLGREYLLKNHYDILLLDLVLPVNSGDIPAPKSGSDFLDEIHYNPNINIPIHIIGLTEFDDAFRDYHENFDDKLWGLINVKLDATDWQEKLKSKIFYLQSFSKRYTSFIDERYKYDFCLITALNIEFEQLLKVGQWTKFDRQDDPLVYYSTIINTKSNNNVKVIACCINQMGMQASAAVSSKILSVFAPKIIFMTGICAGIKSASVNIGDIIIANQSWDYESGKIAEDSDGNLQFKPEIHSIPTNQKILSKLIDYANDKRSLFEIYDSYSNEKPNSQLNVHFGPVGTGPYVLSSKRYLAELISSNRKLLGIDMEGYGIYKASQFHSDAVPIFIKGISDYGDDNKHDGFQKYSSYVSAKFALKYIYDTY